MNYKEIKCQGREGCNTPVLVFDEDSKEYLCGTHAREQEEYAKLDQFLRDYYTDSKKKLSNKEVAKILKYIGKNFFGEE